MEKPAVKTTIVGGRPPGSGKDVGSVPRGLEILIKKASVDPDFKEVLLTERSKAASRIDLTLEETEIAMINTVPGAHLEGMISATKVNPNLKQAFLGCTAAVMLAALTATANASDDYGTTTEGIRPDYNATKGIQPDIVELVESPTAYFRKSEADANLETGILQVKAVDKRIDQGIPGLKIHFVKKTKLNEGRTEGLGYTDMSGVYRIEGVPVGKYVLEASDPQGNYMMNVQEAEIVAYTDNFVYFELVFMVPSGTRGSRPVD